jgi:hypothetical protein
MIKYAETSEMCASRPAFRDYLDKWLNAS